MIRRIAAAVLLLLLILAGGAYFYLRSSLPQLEGRVAVPGLKAAVTIARDRKVVAVDGREVKLEADTLCLHGDNPSAEDNAWAVRKALEEMLT